MNIKPISSLVFLNLLCLLVSCHSRSYHHQTYTSAVVLELVPLGNDTGIIPPSTFVERYDGTGVSLHSGLKKTGAEYVPGIAVLVVKNCTRKSQFLNGWADQSWKVIVESESYLPHVFDLFPLERRLPSFPQAPMVIVPKRKAAFVIGSAFYCGAQHMEDIFPLRKMYIEYNDGIVLYRSNTLLVRQWKTPSQMTEK